MMLKTHLAMALFFLLIFIQHIEHKILFSIVLLIAAVIPDLDSKHSKIGNKLIFRILQFFTKHRGVIHSFTICIIISVILVFTFPILALPFFIGYSVHLFADSFTVEGIEPFWPYKGKSAGMVSTGGNMERIIFLFFAIVDLAILVLLFLI